MGEAKEPTAGQLDIEFDDDDLRLLAVDHADLDENFRISASSKYTLTTISKDAGRVSAILSALAANQSLRKIIKTFKVSGQTLKALEAKHLPEISARKERLAGKCELFAEYGVDRLIHEAEDLPIGQMAMATAIMMDKASQLRGEATSIIKVVGDTAPKPADFVSYLAGLRDARGMGSVAGVDAGKKGDEIIDLEPADFEEGESDE